MARRSVMSSVSTDRVRDCLTYPVLRLLRVDTGAIVVCEAGIAAVAIARHGDSRARAIGSRRADRRKTSLSA